MLVLKYPNKNTGIIDWRRPVWFRRPDTDQWWPVIWYPSHKTALQDYPLDRMTAKDQVKRLNLTFLTECAEQQAVPVVRMLGLPEPTLWAVVSDDSDGIMLPDRHTNFWTIRWT